MEIILEPRRIKKTTSNPHPVLPREMAKKLSSARMKANQVRAVILDYGMVLCRPPRKEHVDRIAATFGVDHEAFWRLYERNRGPLDKGDMTPAVYWKAFAKDSGTKLDATALRELQELDIEMWETLDHSMVAWAAALRANGFKTALLSNLHLRFAKHIRKNRKWLKLFDHAIFSSEIRLLKPDPGIYRYTLRKIRMKAADTLFVDDRLANIESARDLGISGIHFTTVAQLIEDLRAKGFPYLPANSGR
jgi:putative hydrolase of the HAD superfamily